MCVYVCPTMIVLSLTVWQIYVTYSLNNFYLYRNDRWRQTKRNPISTRYTMTTTGWEVRWRRRLGRRTVRSLPRWALATEQRGSSPTTGPTCGSECAVRRRSATVRTECRTADSERWAPTQDGRTRRCSEAGLSSGAAEESRTGCPRHADKPPARTVQTQTKVARTLAACLQWRVHEFGREGGGRHRISPVVIYRKCHLCAQRTVCLLHGKAAYWQQILSQ